ncbi:pyridoxal-dependent decarboxylase [Haloechinothrix sp. LS1_15]|uniref:pyridoxal phosphate-dependent decarboxylase family protein n=1 Tax=Haloechinothrix sp. LS1_15 TaxID=2652248 RepID=UPI0029458094|nr:pyridoxal-dependent decarboxylase [Haloechinothrix sp. LS1_15]MDV6012742.1 aminotransferase class V-fold PLP-dependent enzyme [Haloechinothrix sp. LS1_15]
MSVDVNTAPPAALGHGEQWPLVPGAELAAGPSGPARLSPLIGTAVEALAAGIAERGGPAPARAPEELAERVRDALGWVLPDTGTGSHEALDRLSRMLAAGSVDPADPACAAHLHCPPLAVAVAAEVVSAALNPSLDSWDQAPAATTVETEVIAALARLTGYRPDRAAGVLTGGGTESNLMGMALARDAALRQHAGTEPAYDGVGGAGYRLRIFCSAAAHFSVQRNAALLGLGEASVTAVPVDDRHRMDPAALARALEQCTGIPAMIVATAGTTDLGAIDPLPEIAEIAAEYRVWLHTDGAYGGGALLSGALAPLLDGIERSDSVALDLHKLGWQPIASGVFLAADGNTLEPLARRVAYLNPADDEDAGYDGLLGRSLRTTRRADAFKIAVTMRALGRSGLGELVERCHALARYAAEQIEAHPALELAAHPTLTTVAFRYRAFGRPDRVNAELRRRLLRSGRAVVGRTELFGAVWLKLTLLNPHASETDIDAVINEIVMAGTEEDG